MQFVALAVLGTNVRRALKPVKNLRDIGTAGYVAGGVFVGLLVWFGASDAIMAKKRLALACLVSGFCFYEILQVVTIGQIGKALLQIKKLDIFNVGEGKDGTGD